MLLLLNCRAAVRLVGAGVLIGVVCWFFGLDAWRASLSGCSVTVAGLVLLSGSSDPDSRDLGWRRSGRARQRGSRSDVASLSSLLHPGWGYVDVVAFERLQSLVRRRLLLEGLDLDQADQRSAIERRIGPETYGVLAGRQGRVPTLRALISCLDALDETDSTHYPAPQPRARPWGPAAGDPIQPREAP
ncbi:MAG: hypothetical protein ACRDLT_10610 [Solirubrobacteraceae bacterium]